MDLERIIRGANFTPGREFYLVTPSHLTPFQESASRRSFFPAASAVPLTEINPKT